MLRTEIILIIITIRPEGTAVEAPGAGEAELSRRDLKNVVHFDKVVLEQFCFASEGNRAAYIYPWRFTYAHYQEEVERVVVSRFGYWYLFKNPDVLRHRQGRFRVKRCCHRMCNFHCYIYVDMLYFNRVRAVATLSYNISGIIKWAFLQC